jgi:hypothetical protein
MKYTITLKCINCNHTRFNHLMPHDIYECCKCKYLNKLIDAELVDWDGG